MIAKHLKSRLKRAAASLGLWKPKKALPVIGEEKDKDYYDRVFADKPLFLKHYARSCYYPTWCVIVDRVLTGRHHSVLEIGCGTGQLANMLCDNGIPEYLGLDFSPVAIARAQSIVPSYRFVVGDARDPAAVSDFSADVIICTEVLEHITEDVSVITSWKPGLRCICTVPNLPYKSHVRHFRSTEEVLQRYGSYLDDAQVWAIRGTRSDSEVFYLLDGIRNTNDDPSAATPL